MSRIVTESMRLVARAYDVPLWALVPGGWRWRRHHVEYSRRLRARRRRKR